MPRSRTSRSTLREILLERELRRVHADHDEALARDTSRATRSTYGNARMQLMQEYVQKSTSTTLPRSSSRDQRRGVEPLRRAVERRHACLRTRQAPLPTACGRHRAAAIIAPPDHRPVAGHRGPRQQHVSCAARGLRHEPPEQHLLEPGRARRRHAREEAGVEPERDRERADDHGAAERAADPFSPRRATACSAANTLPPNSNAAASDTALPAA